MGVSEVEIGGARRTVVVDGLLAMLRIVERGRVERSVRALLEMGWRMGGGSCACRVDARMAGTDGIVRMV